MIFRGNTRLFDKPEQELTTSTGTAKLLTIDGVNALTDIAGKIIPIIAKADGDANATLNINSLGAKDLMYYGNSGITNVVDDWITYGQLYLVIYDSDNDYFIMFNFIHILPDTVTEVYNVNSNILNLTSSSSAEDITTAFGSTDAESNFISAIQTNKVITLTNLTNYETLIPIKYNSTTADVAVVGETPSVKDTIVILDVSNSQIKTLSFTRTTSTFTYTAVTVTTTPISGGSGGGVTEEQVQSMIDESVGTINTELDNINGEVV